MTFTIRHAYKTLPHWVHDREDHDECVRAFVASLGRERELTSHSPFPIECYQLFKVYMGGETSLCFEDFKLTIFYCAPLKEKCGRWLLRVDNRWGVRRSNYAYRKPLLR